MKSVTNNEKQFYSFLSEAKSGVYKKNSKV